MKKHMPRNFTKEETADISMYICTLGNGIADTDKKRVFTETGEVGYISNEGQHIFVDEMGFVTFCDDLFEMMSLILGEE